MFEIDFEEKLKLYDKDVTKFTDTLEGLIEKDLGRLNIAGAEGVYDVCIIREKSKRFKTCVKKKHCELIKAEGRKFAYENKYENLKKFIIFNLVYRENILGVSFRTTISDVDFEDKLKEGEKVIQKSYGFYLALNNGKFIAENIKAKDLLKACTKNSRTGEELEPEENVIYCGLEKEDYICGFDLV